MAFDLQSGYGAGAGADMLQQIIKQKAQEAYQNQALAQEQERIQIESQRAQQQAEQQRAVLQSMQEERAAREQAMKDVQAVKTGGALTAGQDITQMPDVTRILRASPETSGLLRDTNNLQSTALSGVAMPTGGAPSMGPLTSTAAGGPRTTYLGNPEQQARPELARFLGVSPTIAGGLGVPGMASVLSEKLKENAKGPEIDQARQDKIDAAKQAEADRQANIRLMSSLRTPAQGPQPTIFYGGPEGKTPMAMVFKNGAYTQVPLPDDITGKTPPPPNASLDTRLKSAQANLQTAEDIKKNLANPAVAATIGPLMGRENGAWNVVGNPPPEFANLAGQIHSLALSSLAVHGMRSAEAARQIQQDLSLIHTPEALSNYIDGLTAFGAHLLENNKIKPPTSSTTPSVAPPKVTRYDMNGNIIK